MFFYYDFLDEWLIGFGIEYGIWGLIGYTKRWSIYDYIYLA